MRAQPNSRSARAINLATKFGFSSTPIRSSEGTRGSERAKSRRNLRRPDILVNRVQREFQPIADAQFIENIVQVVLDRLFADEHPLGDFFVFETLRHENHD